ncbi:MAG: hypothetical protein ABIC04_08730 [Nanoarchaeota archaeon]
MDTTTAIILTQLPIAIGIFIGAYELYMFRKNLLRVLNKLADKINKK